MSSCPGPKYPRGGSAGEGGEERPQAMVCPLRSHRGPGSPQKLYPELRAQLHCGARWWGSCGLKSGSMHSIFASRFKIIKNTYLDNAW